MTPPFPAASRDLSPARAYASLWIAVAAMPPVFAACTWDPSESGSFFQGAVRFLSVPIVAIELIVILGAMIAGFSPARAIAALPRPARWALAGLAAIAFGTALFVAPNGAESIIRTCMSAVHIVFGLAVYHLLRAQWADLRILIWPSVVLGTCAYMLLALVFAAAVPDSETFDWPYFGLGVTNIRQTGFYSAVGAAAALGLAAASTDRRIFSLWTVAAALLLALSYWSGSRSALIAVPFAGMLCLIGYHQAWRRRALFALMLSLVGGLLIAMILPPVDHELMGWQRIFFSVSYGSDSDAVSSGRITMWRDTIAAIAERPLFGHGESQFRHIIPDTPLSHPHNSVLQIILQWGLIGGGLFFALGVWILKSACSTAGQVPALGPALWVAGALITFSLYEGALYHPYPISMLALALAFILSWSAGPISPPSRQQPASSASATE